MAKKNSIISTEVVDGVITFTVAECGSIEIDLSTLSDEITNRALAHGVVQKVSDAAALPKGATNADKYEAMVAVAGMLKEGQWKKARGEGSGPVAGLIFRAFSQWVEEVAKSKKAKAPTVEAIREVYDAKSRAEQLALRNVPRIAEIIAELKAANAKPETVDASALLADLGL